MENKKTSSINTVFISFLGILCAWSFYRLFVSTWLGLEEGIVLAIIESLVKSLVLILPACLLIHKYSNDVQFPLKEIFGWNHRNFLYGGGIAVLLVGFLVVNGTSLSPLTFPTFNFSIITPYIFITTVVFAGLTEEIFFRGWAMNALLKRMNFFYANIISSLLFLLLHYPLWIASGKASNLLYLAGISLSTFCIGILLGYAVHKEKSIWGAVFAHGIYNLAVSTIVVLK